MNRIAPASKALHCVQTPAKVLSKHGGCVTEVEAPPAGARPSQGSHCNPPVFSTCSADLRKVKAKVEGFCETIWPRELREAMT